MRVLSLPRNRLTALAALLALAVAIAPSGCRKKEEAAPPKPRPTEAPEKAPAVAEKATVPADAVARAGDRFVLRDELDRAMTRLGDSPDHPATQRRDIERKALRLLTQDLLIQVGAEAEGIETTPAEIEEEWGNAMEREGGEEKFAASLEERRLTPTEYRRALDVNLKRTRLRDRYFPETIQEEQMQAYYKDFSANPGLGEKVRVSRIMVKVDQAAHESVWQEAERKILAIKAEIEGGLAFADAVAKYSECPYAKQGGDMGWATTKRRPAETFGPAMKMTVGQLSIPIRCKQGVQLITVTERKNDAPGPYEEERDRIRSILESQKEQANDARLIDLLKTRFRVEILL